MQKQIELAKSWFQLSQILVILAGFFFATAGIAFTNAQNTLNFGINLAKDTANKSNEFITNSLSYVGESVSSNINLWIIYLEIGGIITGLSLLSWGYGKYKLGRIKEKNE